MSPSDRSKVHADMQTPCTSDTGRGVVAPTAGERQPRYFNDVIAGQSRGASHSSGSKAFAGGADRVSRVKAAFAPNRAGGELVGAACGGAPAIPVGVGGENG
eukprot:CAMPEP_0182840904 /NCGR_PEP_ID=MMETSP0006_2-20121128/24727_1 /TAXON_ID=97485 /ORGANISM="Prymnesium parvum, Strain Texoma1" /LENGTH=101 /DNA_ID=CAMNT_0024970309 /DNA_START=116 /DNA_END=421 /DNA_ORIENTATION=-